MRIIIWIFVIAASLEVRRVAAQEPDFSLRLPRILPREPAAALATFTLDGELEIQALATEPLVEDPVAIDVDEFGRAFVAELRGYSLQGAERLGRIKRLDDANQDGTYDTATIFADKLRWPTALVCAFGGILVADAPDLLFLKDVDGDGHSDVRDVVFTGFGTANIQQLLNSLHWGVDLRIYGSSGGNGGVVNTNAMPSAWLPAPMTPQGEAQSTVDLRLRDFVIDPRDWSLAPITGGGQFGMTQDNLGNRFVCSNSDHCQQIVLEDRYLARNPYLRSSMSRLNIAVEGPAAEIFRTSKVEPWRTLRTELRLQGIAPGPIEAGGMASGYFSGASGITFYSGDALPARYQTDLYVADVGSNIVHRKEIDDKGILKSARRVEKNREFISSSDNWFRPVSFYSGPDGALWIVDMYREVVEHPASLPDSIKRHLDLSSGNDRGRLYRVARKGFQFQSRRWPGNCSNIELFNLLMDTNGWHRRTAARILFERPLQDISTKLLEHALSAKSSSSRILAISLLEKRNELSDNHLMSLLDDPQPYIRVHALRIAETKAASDSLRRKIIQMIDDPDERVRFQIALTLGGIDGDDANRAIAEEGFREAENGAIREALASSSNRRQAKILRQLQLLRTESPAEGLGARAFSLELVRQLGLEADHSQLGDFAILVDEGWRASPIQVAQWLVELRAGNPDALELLAQALRGQGRSLEEIVRESVATAKQVLSDAEAPIISRTDAARVLVLCDADQFIDFSKELLSLQQPPQVRSELIAAAGQFADSRIASLLLDRISTMTPEQRGQVLNQVVARESWALELNDRLRRGQFSPVFLDASLRQQLLRHPSEEVRLQAQTNLKISTAQNRSQVISQYHERIRNLSGSVLEGKAIFAKSCANCHRLEDAGSEIGPNLAAFANRGQDALLTNILDPNREVDSRYLAFRILLGDGRMLTGAVTGETESSIMIRDSQGTAMTLTRGEIESLESTQLSLMPELMENDLTPQAMADLISYLMSQRK